MQINEEGVAQIVASVAPISRGAVKSVVKDCKNILETDEEISLELTKAKKSRSLSQNALLWKLLTIYADEINCGRTGTETPESVYYKILDRYGIAVFVAVPESQIESLRTLYRDIKIIDDTMIERNGRRTPGKMIKCIIGSSKYDTEQMRNLIDGIFDELAAMGVDIHGEEVAELYSDWRRQ